MERTEVHNVIVYKRPGLGCYRAGRGFSSFRAAGSVSYRHSSGTIVHFNYHQKVHLIMKVYLILMKVLIVIAYFYADGEFLRR